MRHLLLALMAAGLAAGCGDPDGAPTKGEAAEQNLDGKADWSLDWCEDQHWYDDGQCDWFCPSRDPDCELDALGPDPQGVPTQYPIILAHGFDASPDNRWGFYRVADSLRADGHQVFIAEVPPYNSTEIRAQFLATEIDLARLQSGADKVNIIAHSMGGLDARIVASPGGLNMGSSIASITTIGTAHRGTIIADAAIGLIPGFTEDALDALAELWGGTFSDLADPSDVTAALGSLAEANSPQFNSDHPDAPGVAYESWAGVSNVLGLPDDDAETFCDGKMLMHPGTADRTDLTLLPMALIVGVQTVPHDGMVTVDSAKHGTFRGCLPADHLDLVGQPAHDSVDPNTGFDHLRFYRNAAFDLARAGH